MAESEDLVVRLTAVHALKNAVEDWDFETQIILPYLGIAIHLLLSMVNQVEEADTLMKLISYLSAIMDRTGHEVKYIYINRGDTDKNKNRLYHMQIKSFN